MDKIVYKRKTQNLEKLTIRLTQKKPSKHKNKQTKTNKNKNTQNKEPPSQQIIPPQKNNPHTNKKLTKKPSKHKNKHTKTTKIKQNKVKNPTNKHRRPQKNHTHIKSIPTAEKNNNIYRKRKFSVI